MFLRRAISLAAAAVTVAAATVLTPVPAHAAATTAKKGITAIKYSGDPARLTATGATWFYNWSTTGAAAPGLEYVPQAWNAPAAATIATLTAGRQQGRYTSLLAFNEPDLPDQANMTVDQALDAWPALQSTGLALGSPAPGNYWSGWLDRFMTGAAQRGYRVDFIALHIYPDWTNPGALEEVRGTLADAWAKWHKPIWLTELGTIDTSAWKPMYGTPTAAKADTFLQSVVPLLENLPYVHRYAWFADNCAATPACQYSTLYSAADQLTSHGVAFAAGAPSGPAGRFRLVSNAQPTVALHAAGETYGSSAHQVAVTPANWGWGEQRWTLADTGGGWFTVTDVGLSARGAALQSTFDAYQGRSDSFQVAGTSVAFPNDQQSWALVPG